MRTQPLPVLSPSLRSEALLTVRRAPRVGAVWEGMWVGGVGGAQAIETGPVGAREGAEAPGGGGGGRRLEWPRQPGRPPPPGPRATHLEGRLPVDLGGAACGLVGGGHGAGADPWSCLGGAGAGVDPRPAAGVQGGLRGGCGCARGRWLASRGGCRGTHGGRASNR